MKSNNIKLRIKKVLGLVLIAGGILIMLYPAFTDVYSKGYQWLMFRLSQNHVDEPSAVVTPSLDSAITLSQEAATIRPKQLEIPKEFNSALLEIPEIDLVTQVLKGTSSNVLKKAPGWYEESALPGQGNTAIAGHRTMYGGWFQNLFKLKRGEKIILKFASQSYQYSVENVYTVANDDWSSIEPSGYNSLTLTTCVSGDNSHRLVVRARQIIPEI